MGINCMPLYSNEFLKKSVLPHQIFSYQLYIFYSVRICSIAIAHIAHGILTRMGFSRVLDSHTHGILTRTNLGEGYYCSFQVKVK